MECGERPPGQRREVRRGSCIIRRERIVDHLHCLAGREAGPGLPVLRPPAQRRPLFCRRGCDLLQHGRRRKESRIVRLHCHVKIRAFLCPRNEFRERRSLPKPRAELPPHRLNHPEAHDIAQVAEPVLIASLIGEVCLSALRCGDRCRIFHSHQAPGAGGQEQRPVILSRHSKKGRSGIMCCREKDAAVKAHLLPHRRQQTSKLRPRQPDLLKNPTRQTICPDQFFVPILILRIHQRRRGRIGIFICHHTRQTPVQIVRNHQESRRPLQLLRMLSPERRKLIAGIEL